MKPAISASQKFNSGGTMKTLDECVNEVADMIDKMSLEIDGRALYEILRYGAERHAAMLIAAGVYTGLEVAGHFAASGVRAAEAKIEKPHVIYDIGNGTVN
jgi:hypothetical protein